MTNARWLKIFAIFAIGTLFGVLVAVQVVPNAKISTRIVGSRSNTTTAGAGIDAAATPDAAAGQTGVTGAAGAVVKGAKKTATVPANIECAAGRNGGATDVGISATTIHLATTYVRTGIGAAFLADVQPAMEAVKNKVNAAGGICGRLLDIKYVDDGWNATLGAQYLGNFLAPNSGIFAIPVGASSEGLRLVIDHGDVDRAGMPVVGTDGMLIDQYKDPWVWPVAVSTASSARIMARHAHDLGVKNFAIVFDKNYRFGKEAADAFNNEVKRITGKDVPGFTTQYTCQKNTSFCGVEAGQSSYGTEVQNFQPAANSLIAMFLEPATALQWMATTGAPTPSDGYKVWGAQPLFTRDFAVSCQSACDGMWVWTGYKPKIEDYANDPAVQLYASDLAKTNPQADPYNAFAEGGYDGMLLLVEGLKKVGPFLTRARLRDALDTLDSASGLTLQQTLSWRPGSHFANGTMQGFAIQYKGTFGGWRSQDMVRDPSPALATG